MGTIKRFKDTYFSQFKENILLVMDVNVIKMDITGLQEELMIASMSQDIF
jgi:hypothetical protein